MFVQTAKNAARVLKIAKAAAKTKNAAKAIKASKAAKIVKSAKTAAKGFGENKAYARVEDMNKSDFYRNRNNAGKTYSEPGSKTMKKIKATASVGGAGAAAAYAGSQKKKK